MSDDLIPETRSDGTTVYVQRGPCMADVTHITSGPNHREWFYADGSYFEPWSGRMVYPPAYWAKQPWWRRAMRALTDRIAQPTKEPEVMRFALLKCLCLSIVYSGAGAWASGYWGLALLGPAIGLYGWAVAFWVPRELMAASEEPEE